MTDNPDRQRAIRAEKQVERLEREIELIKSRKTISSPNSLKETDKINFQLQEQVKDLRNQLKNQKAENTKLQETLSTKTTDYEAKLKRMREIFGQASKNIDNYRATIASKNTELEKIKVELEECQVREQLLKETSETQQLSLEQLNTEITSTKTFYGSEIKQLEAKNRQLLSQYEQTKANYEQYKKRAHVLLEKNKEHKSDIARVNELEEIVQQLQSQKAKYELEQQERTEQQNLLEHDLRKAIDRLSELEFTNNLLSKEKNQNQDSLTELKESFLAEKVELESKLKSVTATLDQTTQALEDLKLKYNEQLEASVLPKDNRIPTDSTELDDTTQRLIELKIRVHELEETNEVLNQSLMDKDKEIEKLIISTPNSPPPLDESFDSQPVSYSPTGSDVYASMSSLLSPLVSRQIPEERVGLQKQVERLSELLQESQDKIAALSSQEKVLKDELRKIDAVEKRQNMNVEYLKNVLVKFLVSENKQTMVPIIAKLLCLDEKETQVLRENCA